jgi:multiple sugar transport system permease protein
MPRTYINYNVRRLIFAYALIAPALIVILFVVAYPLLNSIWLSFHDANMLKSLTEQPFVGLRNYITVFSGPPLTPVFLEALLNTLKLTFSSVFLSFVIGFALALLLNQSVLGRGLWRGALLMPWLVPWVSTSLLWMWIMDPQWGVVNVVLKGLGLTDAFLKWFGDPTLAMPAMIVMNVWKLYPFVMVMMLAGLQTLSEELLDAARIDGANRVQVFMHILIPHLRNVIVIVTLVPIIWGFQLFTPIWLITQGGPITSTTTLSILLYKKAFYEFDFGMATTIGTLWLIFLIVFSVVYTKLVGERG